LKRRESPNPYLATRGAAGQQQRSLAREVEGVVGGGLPPEEVVEVLGRWRTLVKADVDSM